MKKSFFIILCTVLVLGILFMVSVAAYSIDSINSFSEDTTVGYQVDNQLSDPSDNIDDNITATPSVTTQPTMAPTSESVYEEPPTEEPATENKPPRPQIPGSLPMNSATIYVYTENSNGLTLQKEDGNVNAYVYVMDTDGLIVEGDATFKIRGNSTAMSHILKKAFNIKFSEKKEILGMGKGKKWSLMSNPFDQTMLRNYVVHQLAQHMGLEYTSQQRFAQLYLDGSFRGLYVVTEPVEEGKDRVDIDIESNDGMNDFLVELEAGKNEVDVTYLDGGGIRFAAKDPDEPNDEQIAYMEGVLKDVFETIKSGNQQEIKEKIDVDSFVKFYVLNEYVKTVDFDFSSVYFYYKDYKLYAGPVWDYDFAMGGFNREVSQNYRDAYDVDVEYASKKHFYQYLCKYDWFNEKAKEVYEDNYEYIFNIYSTNGLIDTTALKYAEEIENNYTKTGWSVTRIYYNYQRIPESTYEGNVDFLKDWLYKRNLWMVNHFEPYADEYDIGDADGDGMIDVLDATAIQRQLAQFDTEKAAMVYLRGDLEHDGLTILDATNIQRKIAGLC